MKKIPTIFERDWEGDRSRVLDEVVPGCMWVIAGEGVATRKYDGTACLVEDGKLWKRREQRAGTGAPPEDFRLVEHDLTTDKIIGWVPVGDGPDDKWYREALNNAGGIGGLPDGTYELLGPKVQGNPERFEQHTLLRHVDAEPYIVPRTYAGMRDLLKELDVEGFVFHHPDGRMAKIKARDFGIKRRRLERV
jgi:hypothetical protein